MKIKVLSVLALMATLLCMPGANAQGIFGGRYYAPVSYSRFAPAYGGYGPGYGYHRCHHHRRYWRY